MNISYLASIIIQKQLVVENVASASIVSKLSQSGIGLAHLELALKRDSVRGGPFDTQGGGFVNFRKKLSGFHLLKNKLSGSHVVRKKLYGSRRATKFVA